MLHSTSYKFMIVALFSLSLSNTASLQAHGADFPIYLGSFYIGVVHGLLKKTSEYIDFKAQAKRDLKKDYTFELLTFISAHMARLQLLDNKNIVDFDTRNLASAWWHGFGQALIETYDVKTGLFTNTRINPTLALTMLGFGGFVIKQAYSAQLS